MAAPLKIAWLSPYPVGRLAGAVKFSRPPGPSHPCSWILNLSAALARRDDVELHLVTETTRVRAAETVRADNIQFHLVPAGLPFVGRGWPGWLPAEAVSGFQRRARLLATAARELRPDIVHAHGTEAAYARAAHQTGRPYLISIQGIITEYYHAMPRLRYRLLRHWEQRAVRQARFFTCRTAFDTGFVRRYQPAARIFHIHEAMNPLYFEPAWRRPAGANILYVGSLDHRKGVDQLLRALAVVRPIEPAAHLWIIGGDTAAPPPALAGLAGQLGLGGAVEFLGRRQPAEIAEWQRRARLFVLPSLIENSPNSLAEAMVAGMPVIATAAGGVPSLVEDGRTGLLVPPADPAALAAKVAWLLQHPAEADQLGAVARQVAGERHRPETVAAATVTAYREILAEAQHG